VLCATEGLFVFVFVTLRRPKFLTHFLCVKIRGSNHNDICGVASPISALYLVSKLHMPDAIGVGLNFIVVRDIFLDVGLGCIRATREIRGQLLIENWADIRFHVS